MIQWPILLALLLSLALSGCGGGGNGNGGGGGGGGGSSRAPAPPVINYAGTTTAYDFPRDDVRSVAAALIGVRGIIRLAESAWVPNPVAGTVDTTIDGDSGSAQITGRIAANLSGFIVVDYSQFTVDGQTIDGRYVQNFRADDGVVPDAFDTPVHGSAEFHGLSITANDTTLRITGVLQSEASGQAVLTANLLFVDPVSGETAWLDNVEFTRNRWTQANGGSVSDALATTINGRLYDGSLGYLDLEQTEAFHYSGNGADPTAVPITGGGLFANGSTLRLELRPLSELYAGLVIDAGGAQFEALRVAWQELSDVGIPVPAGRSPVANAGLDFNTRVGSPTVVHSLFSHDDDGDFLTSQWELLVKPLDSAASLASSITPYASFIPDAAGEYLLKLSVTDGVSVDTSVTRVIAAGNLSEPGPYRTARGDIEGIARATVNESLRFTADSWYRTLAERDQGSDFWSIGSFDLGPATISTTSQSNAVFDFSISAPAITTVRYDGPGFSSDLLPTRAVNVDGGPITESAMLYSPLGFSNALAVADFNNDGLEDLIARVPFDAEDFEPLAREIDGLAVYFAHPDGGFESGILRRGGSGRIAVGDFSNDGLDDIVVTGLDGIFYLRQQADGTVGTPEFLAYPITSCGSSTRAQPGSETQPIIADIFGDGLADISTLNPCTGEIVVWQQLSPTELDIGRTSTTTDIAEANASFGDIDGDGQIDAVFGLNGINNAGPPRAVVYTRTPLGSLREVADLGGACANADEPFSAIADLNADQRQDVIVVNGCEIAVHYQQVDGSFLLGPVTVEPALPGRLVRVTQDDYDSDGDPDLFIIGSSLTRVFAFLQDDHTYRIVFDNTQRNFVTPVLMDFDRNGVPDLVSSSAGNRISLPGPDGEAWPLAQIMLGGL